jgi:phosphatidylserine synthase
MGNNLFYLNTIVMNIYYAFYCRAYDWYNTTGKKSKSTLRSSAISLLSGLPCLNGLTIVFLISIIQKHTSLNKWVAVLLFAILIISNSLLINSKKSEELRSEYLLFDDVKRKKINFYFYFYFVISVLLFFLLLGYGAYFKNKYGNYDL